MKSALSLILAFVLCLSLCACSAGGDNDQNASTSPVDSGNQIVAISLGQKITAGEYSLEITAVDFIGSASIEVYGNEQFASSGNSLCVVRATLYNNSRKECLPNIVEFVLNYDNGYDTHTGKPDWNFAPNSYYMPDLQPNESLSFLTLIELPEFQANDTAPMKLDIKFYEQSFEMTIDRNQLSVDGAIALFAEERGQAYFKDKMAQFPLLSQGEIKAAFSGKLMQVSSARLENGSSFSYGFQFEANGKIKEIIPKVGTGYFNNRTWEVKDNAFILDGEHVCEVRRINDETYLFIKNGLPYLIAY